MEILGSSFLWDVQNPNQLDASRDSTPRHLNFREPDLLEAHSARHAMRRRRVDDSTGAQSGQTCGAWPPPRTSAPLRGHLLQIQLLVLLHRGPIAFRVHKRLRVVSLARLVLVVQPVLRAVRRDPHVHG